MDLLKINCKALLVPTPGQTEQEYLVTRSEIARRFNIQKQDSLDISSVRFDQVQPQLELDFELFKKPLGEFIEEL